MSRRIGFAGLSAALGVILLTLMATLPTVKLACFFLAVLLIMLTVMAAGVKYALLCYAATALLGWFFFPAYPGIWAYALFFGYYPILKLLIERLRRLPVEWALKLALFMLCAVGVYLLFPQLIWYFYPVLIPLLAAADLLLSRIGGYLQHRFSKLFSSIRKEN